MRKHLAALALLSAVAMPTAASAQATITPGAETPIIAVSAINDFYTELTSAPYSYTRFTTTGASISLATDSWIDFYFLGSESGYTDSLEIDGVPFAELNTNAFAAPVFLVSRYFGAGNIVPGSAGVEFTTDGAEGNAAILGDAGFGIFMAGALGTQEVVDRFVIGYDDQITGPDDDNHDDLMVLAVVRSAVPEPGTWAMLLAGFGMLGAAMRRKSKAPRVRAAIA